MVYDVLMVDPPWPVGGNFQGSAADCQAPAPYRTTSISQIGYIISRDILSQAAMQHSVFLWLIDRYLSEGEGLLLSRGYHLHTRLVWDKGAGPGLSQGQTFTVQRHHEYLSWFYKGALAPVAPEARGRFGTVIRAPSREHSRKPEAAYRLVEALYPDARRLDAFTREYHPGWDGWGDQRDHFTPLLAPLRIAGEEVVHCG